MALESRRARIKEVRGYAPVACLSVTPKSSRSVLGTLHSLTGFGRATATFLDWNGCCLHNLSPFKEVRLRPYVVLGPFLYSS